MIDTEKTQIRVGMFVFAGLVLALYIVFMIGGENQLFRSQYTLKASFEDISGLRVGAPIQLAGLKVGYVDGIDFPKELKEKKIELTLKINRDNMERIRKDSVATINTQGLLGDKFIYISVGSAEAPVLEENSEIKTQNVESIFNLAEKGGEILSDVKKASEAGRKFFEDMYSSKEDVRTILHSMKEIMQQAEKGDGLLHAMLYDPKGKEVIEKLSSMDAGEVMKNFKDASKELKELLERVNRGEGTIGALLNDPAIYNELREFVGRANRNKLLKAVVRSTLAENEKIK